MIALRLLGVFVGVLLLGATALWLGGEIEWSKGPADSPERAFTDSAIGLETLPLKYALVLEEVSGAAFRTGRENGRDLWWTYGFLDNPRADSSKAPACVENAADKLPIGFSIGNAFPVKSFASPVAFVGLTCAACHSAELHVVDGHKVGPIYGAGNQSLDLIAWGDGIRNAVLDPSLSASRVLDAYEARCGAPTGLYERTIGRLLERSLIDLWIAGIRDGVGGDLSRYDLPYHGAELMDSAALPAGPGRTRPFRSILRVALNLPGADNMALSKIPVVFEQTTRLRPRSQYDGSIGNPVTRSVIAAYTSGASLEALAKPETVSNITNAAAYTEMLGITAKVLSYVEAFPSVPLDPQRVAAGAAVYERHCNRCHGHRDGADQPWSLDGAMEIHQISPVTAPPGQDAIGTDGARLNFRYAQMLPLGIWTAFPGFGVDLQMQKDGLVASTDKAKVDGDLAGVYFWEKRLASLELDSFKYRLGHPLNFAQDVLSYSQGYVNNPIPRTYLRAPYLHNGSVPNLHQLINLDARPAVFCRGKNIYDPAAVGYVTASPDSNGQCSDDHLPFRFDTTLAGNSNEGHDFPWRYDDPNRDVGALRDLLEYLKIL